MKNSHDISCTKCDENFITEEELGRHMNNEYTKTTANVTLEEMHPQIETKKEEDSSNNPSKEQFDYTTLPLLQQRTLFISGKMSIST